MLQIIGKTTVVRNLTVDTNFQYAVIQNIIKQFQGFY